MPGAADVKEEALRLLEEQQQTEPLIQKPEPAIIQPTQHIIKDNIFTDPRDGQKYKTVQLKDGKVWMAQNLNFDVGNGCFYYDNDPENREKYGWLYNWKAALKACPPGWHLPSDDEWWNMAKQYGIAYNGQNGKPKNKEGKAGEAAYQALIQGGDSGFAALLGGYRISDGSYYNLGDYGVYWSSTERDASYTWIYNFYRSGANLARDDSAETVAFSCRCVED